MNTQIPEPKFSRFLFADTRMSWLWLIIRLYVGYEWITAGWGKLMGGWIGADAGTAIQAFFTASLQKTGGAHPSVSAWYAYFIEHVAMQHVVFFSWLITFGELAVGIGLILGLLTGIAALGGAFMNLNYLFAGTISTNPLLGFLGVILIMAWRTAGWLGLDRFVLPRWGIRKASR